MQPPSVAANSESKRVRKAHYFSFLVIYRRNVVFNDIIEEAENL